MKKTLLLVLIIHTFLFSQIMILKNQDKIIIDNNQTLALNHVNHDQKQILKEHNNIDSRVKKLLEEKPKKDSNLSKEDEELFNKVIGVIQTIGNVYNAKDSKERDELIRDLASNYLSLQANTLIQEYLHALNHSINSEFNLNYNDRGGLSGNAKVLLPIMSEDNPKISYFLQSGIGGYDNNRIIGHFGGGIRYYPNALALDNSGNIMLGLNLVYDHDFSREHKRISLGFESMLDTLAFHANIYQRLSDWINSYDFKNANNDLTFLERPANGWDMGIKYAFPSMSNVAVFANMSKWYGEKVAPFGNVNCYEDLEKNPLVYEGGITYSPCPALTFSLSHKRSNESDKQGTNIAMNFNIPLDKDAFKHAFDTKLAGINNTIEGSRTHFIDRDYSMVLEYKAINNTYHISYCGNLGGNTHCIMLKDGFNQAVKNVAMSVTPEQKSVILKDGNHYITDSNGKVFVKIIHSYGVHQTNLIAKVGNAQESFPITIIVPKEDFRIFAKPSNIQRYEKSLITFTGNDLAGDLAIHWKLNGKGSLEKTPNSDKTDKDGNSNIIYKPDVNMKDKEKAEIIANVLGVTLKTFVQIAIYGDNDIILDKAIIGNKEKTHASYKNLKANSTKVKWSIQGDNALFVDKDKTTKELNLIADDKGESNVEIIGLSGNEKVKIIAKNMSDELVKERSKDLEIKNYTATMELPTGKDPVTHQDFEKGMIDYKSDFEVKLKGLMPKTKVLWKAKDIQSNKTLRISNDKESTADDKGESKVVFEGVKDFNIKRLQIIATYNQSAASTQEVSGEIKLHQYTPSISFSKDKIHAYESDNNKALKDPKLDHVEVTLKGGKPNEKIEWSLSGDATLSNQEATFNASGEAKAVIASKAPFKVNPNLEVKTMTKDLKKELPYEIKEYTPKVEYPSFKTQEKTIDYIDDFNIKISGLLPNSTIDKISGSKGVKAKKESFNVNDKGETTLEFSGISDYSVKDIAIKFNYIKQGSIKKELNLDKIKLYQYAISFNADPSTIIAEPNKNAEVTLKGGKPNEKIEWSLSGDATLTKTDKVFNVSGEAKAVITSKAPFKTNPIINVNTLGQNLTKTLTYIDGTIYTPKIEYPSYKVSFWKTLDKTIDYDSDYVLKISGLLPNSTIDNISGSKGVKAKKESFNVNNKGEATLEFSGISDPSVKELTIKFSYMKSAIAKTEITADKINLYQRELNLELDKEILYTQEGEVVHAVLKGGKTGSKVEWSLSGDATLNDHDTTFNASGEAKTVITSKAPFENDILLKVNALGDSFVKSIKYKIKIYTPEVEYPSYKDPSWWFHVEKKTIDYDSDYVLKISGLLPNSTIDKISGSKGVKAKKESFNVNDKGEATLEFSGISDYSVKDIAIKFNYMKTRTSKIEFAADKIKLYQRELKFEGDKTIYTEEKAQANITLKDGKKGAKVEWNISGDATLNDHDTTFNSSGEAKATITSKAPFKDNPVINVNTIGQSVSTTITYVDKEYIPSIIYPSYKGYKQTIELNQDFHLEVSNLIPNTEIEIYHDFLSAAKPKQDHVRVNSSGKATLEFYGVSNPLCSNFNIQFKYMKTKNKSADFFTDEIYIYKQLTLIVDKNSFNAQEGEEAHAILKGGKPYEKVEWNISGDATLNDHDTTFNSSGEAKATITSKTPFKNNPVISVNALGQEISKTITYNGETTLVLDIDKNSFNAQEGEEAHAILKGGKPYEKVEWNISGDATLNDHDTTFNSSGEAKATITSKTPFKNNPVISVNALGQEISKTITYNGETTLVLDIDKNSFNAQEGEEAHAILKGGKPYEKVEWNISGDATLNDHDTTFNSSGEAKATITSKTPFKNNPVISVNALGQEISKTITYNGETTLVLDIDKNSFNAQEGEEAHAILKGGKPYEKVEWNISGDATLNDHDTTFNSSGEAKATITSKTPFKNNPVISVNALGQEISKTITYNGETTLVLDIDKNSFNAQEGEEAHAILKGGKPYEKVEWNISGDATLNDHDTTFNSSGEAKATITSKTPFKNNPVISVNAMGKNLSKELNYKKIPIQLTLGKTRLNPYLIETVSILAKGTPYAKIKWSIVGDGVLPKEDLIPKYFDSKGVALTKFRTINPNVRPITVSVEYEDGSEKASETAVFNGPIRPRINVKNIPFDTGATIELYGLIPNSSVDVQPDQYLGYTNFVNKGTLHTDDKGSVYLNFKPIGKVTEHTGRIFSLKVKYKEWDGADSEAIVGSIEVQKRIHAIYDTWKDPASCYTSATLTLTDGIAGEKVDFSGTNLLVGLGQTVPIIQRWDKEFDNSGEAKVVISTTWCTKPLTDTPTFTMRFNTLGVNVTETRAVTFGGGDHERFY
ncbi:inverse autotransporter beta domain-containing protein [Campylobacter sp. CNRCH_2013_0898h]|uniref:inverse autotransporter beta domain-containing protein n=2 Tax=unclassified Campylobacter TaxID=2593542 RepID=UPI0021E66AF5|nr:inverse autotransporter beta domain-containing protein [Campylobacter sp. CNRCH_2013_0898h]MCV3553613.1 inverse autotransporter beta domain-containing protein [Campylobacter sp. CNRCH_2013_0898h]